MSVEKIKNYAIQFLPGFVPLVLTFVCWYIGRDITIIARDFMKDVETLSTTETMGMLTILITSVIFLFGGLYFFNEFNKMIWRVSTRGKTE